MPRAGNARAWPPRSTRSAGRLPACTRRRCAIGSTPRFAWASHGIEATEALARKELGLTTVEEKYQQEHGRSAMQTTKAWWQAGIPFEEVTDWIGAGLTAEEATAQRASGVTVEQAAVLSSWRKEK